ncbi:hypothetical protein MUG84_19450 [Paenibacillus sp. KQZ6P-2]|uniref:Uncharacterized protein n=1 Tax=Paenibacillus mangrovi TaxID=2931978 RepID=A0A9X2B3Z0_9BACL|nr:hypothetical protein [Paenibacillus mangrovi]MCJ8013906.1 hypothetical protein [Paenibacillus mangrovi]
MWIKIILWIVLIGLLILGRYASSRSSWGWGGIIPVVVLISSIVVFMNFDLSVTYKNIAPYAMYLLIHLIIWVEGRTAYRKRQQKELDKMNALDIR